MHFVHASQLSLYFKLQIVSLAFLSANSQDVSQKNSYFLYYKNKLNSPKQNKTKIYKVITLLLKCDMNNVCLFQASLYKLAINFLYCRSSPLGIAWEKSCIYQDLFKNMYACLYCNKSPLKVTCVTIQQPLVKYELQYPPKHNTEQYSVEPVNLSLKCGTI